ncbi:hypothetical protein [Algibacter sp. 2305UL17-15]|uniref:hypothetical protein n=1 Tax=Algibacter sp. 2305UL17-15 TaxID=3231268 RepID=UPI003458960E
MKIKIISLLMIMFCIVLWSQQSNQEKTDPDELLEFLEINEEDFSKNKPKRNSLLQGRSLGYSEQNNLGKSKHDENYKSGLDYFMEDNPYEADEILNKSLEEHRTKEQSRFYFKWGLVFTILISAILIAYFIIRKK